jgi:hypothetical protein
MLKKIGLAFSTLFYLVANAHGEPITLTFSGQVLNSYSQSSWVGLPLSGTFTIFPENFESDFSHYSETSSQIYSFTGPAYNNASSPIIDYSINLPDGTVYRPQSTDIYADWDDITVHHLYLDGPGEEDYEIGRTFQPSDRSYQSDFYIILQNNLADGALLSGTSIDQTPNPLGATYENAALRIFNYNTMSYTLDFAFSVDTLTRSPVPEPASWRLMVLGLVGLGVLRKMGADTARSIRLTTS